MSLRPVLLWLTLNLIRNIQYLSLNNIFVFNFTYPLRCLHAFLGYASPCCRQVPLWWLHHIRAAFYISFPSIHSSQIQLLPAFWTEPLPKGGVSDARSAALPPPWDQDVTATRGRRYVWRSRVAKSLRYAVSCLPVRIDRCRADRPAFRSNSHFLRISNYLHGLMTDWHSWWRIGL
jgi:hypothetical protein